MYESGLRFRLYGYEKFIRDKLFGEMIISLIEFDLEGDGEVLWWMFILRNVLSVSRKIVIYLYVVLYVYFFVKRIF